MKATRPERSMLYVAREPNCKQRERPFDCAQERHKNQSPTDRLKALVPAKLPRSTGDIP